MRTELPISIVLDISELFSTYLPILILVDVYLLFGNIPFVNPASPPLYQHLNSQQLPQVPITTNANYWSSKSLICFALYSDSPFFKSVHEHTFEIIALVFQQSYLQYSHLMEWFRLHVWLTLHGNQSLRNALHS